MNEIKKNINCVHELLCLFFFNIKDIINKGGTTVVTIRGNYGESSQKDTGRM